MEKVNFLIVGAGLAGSILAWELLHEGKTVALIEDPSLPTSSRVAGGLFNPITGKYLKKTWLAEELFSDLKPYYQSIEKQFNQTFYHETGLFWAFSGEEHEKSSRAQINKYELDQYISLQALPPGYETSLANISNGMYLSQAGWLDIPIFLDELKAHFQIHTKYIKEHFNYSALKVNDTSVEYNGVLAEKIIFCEGYYAKDNPFFSWLPFNPAKGETLIGKIKDYKISTIINSGKWIIPLGNEAVRVGSTYTWDNLNFNSTVEAQEEIFNGLNTIIKNKLEITEQQAGVRPTTKDRRPFLGSHPKHKNLYIFNGLGTKGVSLAPYFAKQLVRNILYDEVINEEANIKRFFPLYS